MRPVQSGLNKKVPKTMNKLYSSLAKKWRKYFSNESGVAAVEFAIVAPVFIMLVMAIIDFGRIYFIKSSMQYVVEQAARHAMVNQSISASDLNVFANTEATNVGLNDAVFASTPDDSGTVNFMIITGTYNFTFITPLVGTTLVLDAKSATPISED